MRAVFSAMRRSLASAATCFASSKRGARNTSRLVLRTAIPSNWAATLARSSNVMVGSLGSRESCSKCKRGSRLAVSPISETSGFQPLGSAGSTGVPADFGMIRRLLGRRLHRYDVHRHDRDVGSSPRFGAVRHAPVNQGKQRIVPAQANVFARMPFGAALPHDNIAGTTRLAAEQFDAEALARGIAAVARGSACFLMRHGDLPSSTKPL